MDIRDMKVTYTPGSGYTGYVPGCKVTMRWGDEFIAQMKERAAQKAADPAAEVEAAAPRKKLTDSDLAELAEKYDPSKMTQEEYDSLLEDLIDMGVLKKDEVGQLGYHGCVVVGSLAEGGFGFGVGCYQIDGQSAVRDSLSLCCMGLSDTDGDALAYAKLMGLWKPVSGSAGFLAFAEKGRDSFTALADALEAIEARRKD